MLRALTNELASPMLSGQLFKAVAVRHRSKKPDVLKACPPVRVYKEDKAPNPRELCATVDIEEEDENKPKEGCLGPKKKKVTRFVSMWYNPECCVEPCADTNPRYDELYYQPSDKETRKYTRTWKLCDGKLVKVKKTCCLQKIKPPKLPKRKPPKKPKTACSDNDAALMSCSTGGSEKCRTLLMPRCKNARKPPRCSTTRKRTDCKKICAPYPSFSECLKDKLREGRPVECGCLRVPPMCEIYEHMRKIAAGSGSSEPVRCRGKK